MAKHPRTVQLNEFKGLNNKQPPDRTPDNYQKKLVNFDLDAHGNIQKRPGYERLEEGNFHSLWSDTYNCYVVKDGELVELSPDTYTASPLTLTATGVQPGAYPVSFARIDEFVYFSSENTNGKIKNGQVFPWGVECPQAAPSLVIGNGSLGKGAYSVAFTYVTAEGQESGSSTLSYVEVQPNSSLVVQNIPQPTDPNVHSINVYCTHQNGTDLYKVGNLPLGATSLAIFDTLKFGRKLRTLHKRPAPRGTIVRNHQGYILVADERYLWFSEPLQYDLFDLRGGFVYFERPITAVCPVDSGVWVSDEDKLYYLDGKDPKRFIRTSEEPTSIVPHSAVSVPGDVFGEGTSTSPGKKWLVTTSRGLTLLMNGGQARNLTQKNISLPKAADAAAALFEENGVSKYISLLSNSGKEVSSNTRVGDKVTATIIRNGVAIT